MIKPESLFDRRLSALILSYLDEIIGLDHQTYAALFERGAVSYNPARSDSLLWPHYDTVLDRIATQQTNETYADKFYKVSVISANVAIGLPNDSPIAQSVIDNFAYEI